MAIIKTKESLVIVMLLTLSLPIFSVETKTINLSYSSSDFCLIERNGQLYIDSNKYSFSLKTDTSEPALPYMGIYLWIDSKYDYNGHSVISQDTLLQNNVIVAPNPQPSPSNYNYEVSQSSHGYQSSIYPDDCIEYMGTSEIGGVKILCFSVCPFLYSPVSKELYLRTNISLNISLSQNSLGKRNIFTDPTELVGDFVINKEEMIAAYRKEINSSYNQNKSSNNTDYCEYLIVTCDSLKDAFNRLAYWKTMKGVRSKVITTDSIYSYSTETRPQLKIKKAIKDYYTDSEHKLKYVLLGGDHEIVPAEHCRLIIPLDTFTTDTVDVPTDLFYASLKSISWDTNNNGFNGELTDNVDIVHDIFVTRLSVNSISDAKNQIDRIIKYEMNPDTINWENNILMSGNTLNYACYNYPEGFMSDTHYKSEKFYQKYIQNNWPNHHKYMFYDTGTSFTGGAQYHFRVNNLTEQLSNGYIFANVATHGGTDCWRMESREELIPPHELYYTSDAMNVENARNTIIITTACETNAFSSDTESLSEGFMRNPDGGVICYYGSATYGWHYKDSINENPSQTFIGAPYKNLLLSKRHQIGKAIYDSKFEFRFLKSHYMWRSLLFGMNGLCDPEMPVYLSSPTVFNNVNLSFSNNTISITTGIPDCCICVMSRNDNGDSYYNVVDSTQSESFNVPSGSYNICVTKTGYVPYTAIVGDTVYIQDEIINSKTLIIANHTLIGEDVLTDMPHGPVIINERSSLKQCFGDVTIPKGLEVKKGAELVISPNGN